jgi:DEAD/DEAH box helicase domain-containing protein
MTYLTQQTQCRFLAFVDSRKQTEQISAILAREQDKDQDEEPSLFRLEHLEKLDVLPFRSGYEEEDRKIIQDRLNRKSLRGIVSTSALELGMDIPSLDTAILVGVPRSATSLTQRIGRIGRSGEGAVLVLNTGSVYDEAVFSQPENFLNRPLAEGALYLENQRIQYIHALCLARNGGEHDQILSVLKMKEDEEFASSVTWPDGFIELCKRERRGEVTAELQGMKSESGDDPTHVFPLRDVESSFKVEFKRGPEQRRLGTLSYGQVMREAYPGAIYYYAARPYRIFRVNVHSRVVQARHERGYTSKPQSLPTLVFPNLTVGNVFRGTKFNELTAVECNLQIRESICGIKERRGPNELAFGYPMAVDGIFYNQQRFARNYFTTGVVITHPALGAEKVSSDSLAKLLLEAFLMIVPYERRDISVAVDRHRADRGPISEGQRFIALYDQTYGSLRLSGRILEGDTLRTVAQTARSLLDTQEFHDISPETVNALDKLCGSFVDEMSSFSFDSPISVETSGDSYVQVIMPGSKGLNLRRSNEEFEVEAVFYSPQVNGLAYRGRYPSTTGETTKDIVPLDFISEIPGESKIGQYNLNSGEIEEFRML